MATETTKQVEVQQKFYRHFNNETTALQQQIDRLGDTALAGGERIDATEHCLAGITRLSNEVKDAFEHLPAYDQRSYSQTIKDLSARLQDVRAASVPRTKFAFTTGRKNNSAISLTDAAQLATEQRKRVRDGIHSGTSTGESSGIVSPVNGQTEASQAQDEAVESKMALPTTEQPPKAENKTVMRSLLGGGIRKPSFSQSNSVAISNLTRTHVILPSSAAHATSSGTVSHLRHCVVDMSVPTKTGRPFAGLTLKDIKDSLIVCGHVSGPIHITGLEGAILVVACRQFRMHESKNCDVYLHCASRPIVEDCKGIRFAPLPECYKTEAERHTVNKWSQVDDFKWLRSEPSPNWKTLPQSERVEEMVWTEMVPGSPNHGLEAILKAVKSGRE